MKSYRLTYLWRTLQTTLLTLLAFMGALALLPVFHRKTDLAVAGSKDMLSVEAQVDRLSMSLLEYLENHHSDALTQIAREGKEITRLLAAYNNDLRADQLAAFSQLNEASRTLREATVQIIAADNAQLEDKARLDDLQKQLKDTLDEMPQGSRRITSQIGTVARLAVDIDAQQTQIEKDALQKAVWFQKFSKAHEELNQFLQESEPNPQPRKHVASIFSQPAVVAGGIWVLGLCAGFGVLGLGWLLRRRMFQPLQDLVATADAAASGDFSRTPDIWAQDEIGQMAKALNRLTSVLARSENLVYHLATLVDASGDGIISQTLEGTILSWNKGAQRIYGYSAEEVKGQSVTFLTPHEGAGQLTDVLERVKRGEKVQPFEMIHEGKNGRLVHVFLRVAGIYDSTRKIIGASISAQDLTAAPTPSERTSGDYSAADALPDMSPQSRSHAGPLDPVF